jgi:Zn-dependent M28 family amino/carboxypeptidase
MSSVIIIIWWLPGNRRQTLPPAHCRRRPPQFSAEQTVEHIRSKHPDLLAPSQCRSDYIQETLRNLGLEVETQPGGGLVNVVGRIAGTQSSGAVLLTAHLDSVAESPGATDDGSGVAVLLETARALVSGAPMPNTVMFLFTDFEEGGTVGAEKFITRHPWAQNVRVVIGSFG